MKKELPSFILYLTMVIHWLSQTLVSIGGIGYAYLKKNEDSYLSDFYLAFFAYGIWGIMISELEAWCTYDILNEIFVPIWCRIR